jgi:antitoxin component YwqK of YwqJK toxin-antitoxin module
MIKIVQIVFYIILFTLLSKESNSQERNCIDGVLTNITLETQEFISATKNYQFQGKRFALLDRKIDFQESHYAFLTFPSIIPDGDYVILYSTGNVFCTVSFKENKRNGNMLVFWNNGNPKYKAMFNNGKITDQEIHFYPDGKIRFLSVFNQEKVVMYSSFDCDGSLKYVEVFDDNLIKLKKDKLRRSNK